MRSRFLVYCGLAVTLLCSSAEGAPIYGTLNYTGDVRVFNNAGVGTIDFLGGVMAGQGTALASAISNTGDFSPFNSASTAERTGTTVDISATTVFPVVGFLDWNAAPVSTLNSMVVTLLSLVPSAAPVGCPVVMAVNDVCAPFPNSPFTLTRVSTGSQAQIVGFVSVTEGGDTVFGSLNISAQFNINPDQVVALGLTSGGTPQTTFSATVVTVPEPAAVWLSLAGLAGLMMARRRSGRSRQA